MNDLLEDLLDYFGKRYEEEKPELVLSEEYARWAIDFFKPHLDAFLEKAQTNKFLTSSMMIGRWHQAICLLRDIEIAFEVLPIYTVKDGELAIHCRENIKKFFDDPLPEKLQTVIFKILTAPKVLLEIDWMLQGLIGQAKHIQKEKEDEIERKVVQSQMERLERYREAIGDILESVDLLSDTNNASTTA